MSPPIGVLVMSYGTPSSPEKIADFYTDIRRGHPPSPEQLADLRRRYETIGGVSPMAERTRAQVEGLQRTLDESRPGEYRVFAGAKHAPPHIEEAVAAMSSAGIERGVALVLAPHYSALSVGEYLQRARDAAARQPRAIELRTVESWHTREGLLALLADRLAEALGRLTGEERRSAEVLVTAHSLPARILGTGDPYPDQLGETAASIARRARAGRWRVAWQSAGRTAEPWLGPDVVDVIRGLPEEGARAAVVCPAGFVSDHLEVLYDIDVEAHRAADEAGIRLERTRSLNDDPSLLETLAGVVRDAASGSDA